MRITKGDSVCVVDDDASARRGMVRFLRASGFTVASYASASDFLAGGGKAPYGCLILDVQIPGMDGITLQEKLLESGFRKPVIFITAHDDPAAKRRGLKNGAAGFFEKPVTGKDILEAVRRAINSGVERQGSI